MRLLEGQDGEHAELGNMEGSQWDGRGSVSLHGGVVQGKDGRDAGRWNEVMWHNITLGAVGVVR